MAAIDPAVKVQLDQIDHHSAGPFLSPQSHAGTSYSNPRTIDRSELLGRDGEEEVLAGGPECGQSHLNIMPGAPLTDATQGSASLQNMAGAAQQKDFVIKKSKTKRGSSKGAHLMKAYLPSLIQKKDIQMVTPTNLTNYNSSINSRADQQQSSSAKANPRNKFVKVSRSTHGSSSAHQNYSNEERRRKKQIAQGSGMFLQSNEIIVPSDIQRSTHVLAQKSDSSSFIVVDDNQRSKIGLSQAENDLQPLGLRKNKSQVRRQDLILQATQNQREQGVPLSNRSRRNSLMDGQNTTMGGPVPSQMTKERSSLLPPIFSGPHKKQSVKQKLIQPGTGQLGVRSHTSDANPTPDRLRKSETYYEGEKHVSSRTPFASEPQTTQQQTIPARLAQKTSSQNVTDVRVEDDEEETKEPPMGGINITEEGDGDQARKPKVDVFLKNQEKLRQMQEARQKEMEDIEKQRAKLLRRQEKLKNNVLKDAQAYRQRKIEQEKQQESIELRNVKVDGNKNMMSPSRTQAKSNPPNNNSRISSSLASPVAISRQAQQAPPEEDKTSEEKAEEKRRMDMMRKFYRNRYSSFLQALSQNKVKKAEEELALKEAAAKKKMAIKQKVLGDETRIKSRVFDTPQVKELEPDLPVPLALSGMTKSQMNSTAKSTSAATTATAKHRQHKSIRRGSSVSSLSGAEKAYNEPPSFVSAQKGGRDIGSRGSTRANSSKGDASSAAKHTADHSEMGSRTATNFSRGRTLTPKVTGVKTSDRNLKYAQANAAPVSPEEQMIFDERREEEILKEAAERKARAQAIRERQEKQLQAIKDKVAKEKQKEQDEIDRKKRLRELAREQVQQRAEQIKNLPSLREQQDSRLKQKRSDDDGEGKQEKQVVVSPSQQPRTNKMPVDSESFNNFLERNKTMLKPVQLNITDMKEWKKKNRVDPDTKVFIVRGGYGDVRKALKNRGWVENKDKESPCFDFLWTLMTRDVNHNDLHANQIVNHFATATSITTKVGLTHSLKNLIWFNAVDIDTFYPRCYDLAISEELDDFIQEFKQVKAVSYMKIYVREMREAFEACGRDPAQEIKSHSVPDKVYKVALKVCKQRTRDLDDLIDDPNGFDVMVSDAEWAILSQDEHSEETLAAKKHLDWMKKQEQFQEEMKARPAKTKKQRKKEKADKREAARGQREGDKKALNDRLQKSAAKKDGTDDEEDGDDYYDQEYDDEYGDYDDEDDEGYENDGFEGREEEAAAGDEASGKKPFATSKLTKDQKAADQMIGQRYPKFAEAVKVLETLREKFPQFNVDGERNIWILKPAGSSRGRGICLKRDLCEILDLIKHKDNKDEAKGTNTGQQKNGQLYICQKYIENTLIMKRRKFDIRQWVLVTDWNPLTIWIYAEPYIRFPAADFDFDKISNRYAHLSNNSVAKHGKKVTTTYHIAGNMWDLEQFQNYLLDTYGFDVWEEKIVEGIKNIVINSLESVQDNFETRKGVPFEMFGYDIMVDDDFNCWLIEVNSSPAMDYSTDVTERLVKMVLEDTIKVVIDYGTASAKKQKKVDTGLFECVYKAKRIVDKPMNSFGLNLEIHGKKIPKSHLKKY